ncbi:hypothetical protein UFOVP242_118 [uncultured Caudovirales phage]|uniref:Uncharacterized protein n=1 Tax=uncultured Caudovirales phage TaxID=2100421 RepID=A0A6J7WYB2_9CAUD|nr:hypothetical protein UFOVP242_118 [uncultured Caudovirales phage]
MVGNDGLQRAGEVRIEQLKLINSADEIIDLSEFVVELNIYEDIFSNYIQGNIVITDSRNLIDKFNIHGEEFLNVKLRTPSFADSDVIQKTFRVYKLTDREIVRDKNTQNYTLHFVSVELFYDLSLPLFAPFEGTVTDVAGKIFSDFLATSRNFNISESDSGVTEDPKPTELILINESSNKIKFVSPGWSPLKCINWLASKAIPKDGVAKSFIFFESNKNFYFGTLESLFRDAYKNQNYLGRYLIAVSNIRKDENSQNVNRELFLAKDVEMVESTDYIKNYTNGYLGNRLIFLDVFNKDYQLIDYDHVNNYDKQFHTSGEGNKAKPIFNKETFRNFATNISFYPKNPKLFDNFQDNINEKMNEIHGNRLSSMLELTNIKMNMTIPGRTDAEVGRLIYFEYPSLGAKEAGDTESDAQDKLYSGYYLITAIHHKVNKLEHMMTVEVIKDSMAVDKESFERA